MTEPQMLPTAQPPAPSSLPARKPFYRTFPFIWLAVVLVLEIFCFNFASFHLVGGHYEQTDLSLSAAAVIDGTLSEDGVLTSQGEAVTLQWHDLNRPIGSVTLDVELTDTVSAALTVSASDDTNRALRDSIASAKLIAGNRRSQTVVLRLSGNVHELRLCLSLPEGGGLTLRSVSVNQAIPFSFSLLRVGILLLVGLFFWLMLTWQPLKDACSLRPNGFKSAVQGVTLICLLAALFMMAIYATDHSEGLLSEFRLTSGNQITQEIVDAFENGQVHLLTAPSDELLALDNPYDWSARSAAGVSYLWDHCLYNGHYYSYYGISLVLLLFLPYHLLTGYYFSSIFAILLCGTVGILFLSMTYYAFVKKFFPNIPIRLALTGLITLQLSSGIWYCFCAANFYEIAQASGFCFVTAGAYFLLTSNVVSEGKISPLRVALATTCLSLAVLSRPTTAVYCIVALVFLGFGLKKALNEAKQTGKKGALIAYILTAILPFALLGGLQMVYNYLRFDSFLDFGIQYSLTINDFTQSEFHTRFVTIGLYNYLIAPPVLTPEFPFVHSAFQSLHPNGYYFIANYYAVGLIWRALPVLGLCLAPKALKKLNGRGQKLKAAALIGSLSVAAPFAVLWSIWESGYGARYAVDFGWEMVIGALAILFFLYEKCENEGVKVGFSRAAIWTVLPTLLINFALTYAFFKNEVHSPFAQLLFAHLESIFNFWY